MQKDASYHRAAIQYNEELMNFAATLAEKLEHPEIQRWCRAVSKQHKFHTTRHQRALNKLEGIDSPEPVVETPSLEEVSDAADAAIQAIPDEEEAAK